MTFTSSNKIPIKEKDKRYIFLAGSMPSNNIDNWRNQVQQNLKDLYYFFDPTNENHDSLDTIQMEKHVEWELDALEMADSILLNFLPNALSPISLVELGLYVNSKKIYVVCPKEFYKSEYVITLCKKYNVPIFYSLQDALVALT